MDISRRHLVLPAEGSSALRPAEGLRWSDRGRKPVFSISRVSSLDTQLQSGLKGLHWSASVRSSGPDGQLQRLCKERELEQELDVLLRMDQQGIVPSVNTYRCLLRVCAKKKALADAKRVHGHLFRHGFESRTSLGEYSVTTLVQCGGLTDALQVFHRLRFRTAFSWTAVISGYTKSGQAQEALRMYQWMQHEGVPPNTFTFTSLLKACASMKDLEEGKRIHAAAVMHRCDSEMLVCTCLVDMYAKCGSLVDAQYVFDRFPQRDVVAWNAMLAAFAQRGQAEKVFQLYGRMREQGASPNERTLLSMLQACGTLAERKDGNGGSHKVASLKLGRALHADALRKGYISDVFVGSSLVRMYGKCGRTVDAQNVFDEWTQRTVVSWNALLAAFVEQGEAGKALELYQRMWEEAVSPDVRTFVGTLQACGMVAETEKGSMVYGRHTKAHSLTIGKAIHAEARMNSFDSNLFVGNTLVAMYGKCGSILEARHVFDRLPHRNVVTWTSMLAAYVEQGQADQSWQLYEQMWEEGVSANNMTFVVMLQACTMVGEKEPHQSSRDQCLGMGREMHATFRRHCHHSDVFIGSSLISMYGNLGSSECARNIFEELSQPDVVSWNALLKVYAHQNQPEKALQLYEEMREQGISANSVSFVSVLQALGMLAEKAEAVDGQTSRANFWGRGKVMHADAWRNGYHTDEFLCNTLITMYGKCGSIKDAQSVFDASLQHDVVAWNAIIMLYAQQGQTLVAIDLYRKMEKEGVSPNEITCIVTLQACSDRGSLDACKVIHHTLISAKKDVSNLLGTTLIHAYGKCASMLDAQAVFGAVPQPNVYSWTALIAGYARQGDSQASLQSYAKMQAAGIKPDRVTFLALFSVCSHAGLVDLAVEYFESMIRDYGITPDVEHYVTMVDLLGRAGCFVMVDHLLSKMLTQPNLAIWLCLLNACRKHGYVGLGELAFNFAVHLDPKYSASYVLMWGIYADAGLWDRAEEVKEARQREGAWAKHGHTWIEHDQQVHSFAVDDQTHAQQKRMLDLLANVSLGDAVARTTL